MLLCLAIPSRRHVGTVRGHPAVSMSHCLTCHCQKRSAGSGFCRRAMGRRELAAEPHILLNTGVSAPPGALSFQGHLTRGSPGRAASVLPEPGCVPAVPQFPFIPDGRPCTLHSNTADRHLVLKGGFRGCSLSSKALNQRLPAPPSSAASSFLPAEQPSGRVLMPTVDVQQLWDAVLPHTPLPPFPLQ